MSLAIDVDRVTEVLLPDGLWYEVEDGSFEIDAYEFVREEDAPRLLGGAEPLLPAAGATWRNNKRQRYSCPITSILAVKHY